MNWTELVPAHTQLTFAAYGILNEQDDRTIPHPTVVVVDGGNVARYVVSDENHKVRPPADEVLEAVKALAE